MKSSARLLLAAAAALAASAATASKPDLVIDAVSATPNAAKAGEEIEIVSVVRNTGARTKAAIDVDVGLFERATDAAALASLTGWTKQKGLRRNKSVTDATTVAVPSTVRAGSYYICAVADPDRKIEETNEADNSSCTSFQISPSPGSVTGGADLVIESVTAGETVQASLKVKVKIRNAGVDPVSAPFRIKAFKRSPREPLYFTNCPLTEGQLAAGSPSGCPDRTYNGTLAPGEAAEVEGYFNHFVAGAEFVTQPVKPDYKKPVVKRTVDFMVDGCFPPKDQSQVWCAINEIDEINNFRTVTLKSR